MADIYRRSSSPFWYYDIVDADGRRSRRSTRTADEALARSIASKVDWQERRASVFGKEAVLTFGAACGYYLTANKSDRFLAPLYEWWKEVLVKDITAGVIKQTALKLYPKAKPSTRNRQVIAPASAVINHAADMGLCTPIKVKRFKEGESVRRSVDAAYLDALLAQLTRGRHFRLACMMRLAHETGIRVGKLIDMTWSQVRLQDRTLSVEVDKNGDPHDARLSVAAVVELANLSGSKNAREKVFGYASRTGIYKTLRTACRDAGIPYLATHQPGRHSFSTRMMRGGVDLKTIQKAGNWKSPTMVMRYAEALSKDAADAAIDRVFGTVSAHKPKRRRASI